MRLTLVNTQHLVLRHGLFPESLHCRPHARHLKCHAGFHAKQSHFSPIQHQANQGMSMTHKKGALARCCTFGSHVAYKCAKLGLSVEVQLSMTDTRRQHADCKVQCYLQVSVTVNNCCFAYHTLCIHALRNGYCRASAAVGLAAGAGCSKLENSCVASFLAAGEANSRKSFILA